MVQVVSVISLCIFTVLMIGVGIVSARKTKTMEGFLLGSRKMGPWISAFAYGTTYFSAVIFIGYAGMHGWRIGIASIWIGVGNAVVGCLLAWLLLARPTRRMTHALNAKTMPEFLCERYQSVPLKIYTAIIIFIFLVPYAASVYKGLGTMFSAVFPGSSEIACMFIVASLTAFYLVLGGYIATALNDFIQGIIMIFGIAIMVIFLLSQPEVGGISNAITQLNAIDPNLTNLFGGASLKFLLVNIALTSLGVWGLPQMIHKYYAIKDDKAIKTATIVSTAFAAIIGLGAYTTGSLGRLFIPATQAGLPAVSGGFDGVIPTMLMQVFSQNIFSAIILSIILLLLLSASMSTLASIVLTSSSAISVDIINVTHPKITEKNQMVITRTLCFLFVGFSFAFATMKISFIVNLMSFSWGIVAGSFIGPFIWGLYWKKTTRAGAWAGALSGLVTVSALIIFTTITKDFEQAKELAPEFGVTAMAISVVLVPIVSLFTKKLDDKHIEKAFAVVEE